MSSPPQIGSHAHSTWLEERINDLDAARLELTKALKAERERSDEQAKVLGKLVEITRVQALALEKLTAEVFPPKLAKRYPGQPGYGPGPAS